MPTQTKVHSLRKRCKKMRGLLRLAKPLAEEVLEAEDQRFREAARHLAANRDADVYAKTMASLVGEGALRELTPPPVSDAELAASRDILAACRESVVDWPLELHGFVDIGPGFARTYRRCLEAWDAVLRDPRDDNYHRLRKWVKYHWYQVRMLERLNKAELHDRREHLRQLQLDLGDAHDLFVLQTILASGASPDMALLETAITRKHELYANARERGQQVFETSVDDLVARCTTWWADWRH